MTMLHRRRTRTRTYRGGGRSTVWKRTKRLIKNSWRRFLLYIGRYRNYVESKHNLLKSHLRRILAAPASGGGYNNDNMVEDLKDFYDELREDALYSQTYIEHLAAASNMKNGNRKAAILNEIDETVKSFREELVATIAAAKISDEQKGMLTRNILLAFETDVANRHFITSLRKQNISAPSLRSTGVDFSNAATPTSSIYKYNNSKDMSPRTSMYTKGKFPNTKTTKGKDYTKRYRFLRIDPIYQDHNAFHIMSNHTIKPGENTKFPTTKFYNLNKIMFQRPFQKSILKYWKKQLSSSMKDCVYVSHAIMGIIDVNVLRILHERFEKTGVPNEYTARTLSNLHVSNPPFDIADFYISFNQYEPLILLYLEEGNISIIAIQIFFKNGTDSIHMVNVYHDPDTNRIAVIDGQLIYHKTIYFDTFLHYVNFLYDKNGVQTINNLSLFMQNNYREYIFKDNVSHKLFYHHIKPPRNLVLSPANII